MFQEEKGSLDSDGQERDALYEQAERLSNSLVTMGQQLREAVEVCHPPILTLPLQACNSLPIMGHKLPERVSWQP